MAMPADTSAQAVFDSVGAAYEDAFANLEGQDEAIQWLIAELSSSQPAKVLDLGCGTGRPVCSRLADAGHEVLGIDVSPVMIIAARERVPTAQFEQADTHTFDPPAASLDAVTVFFSMLAGFSQDEIKQQIKRIHSWLKPGGLFVYATVSVPGNNQEVKWMGRPVIVSGLSVEDAVAAVREAGFEIVHQKEKNFFPKAAEIGLCKVEDVWDEPHLFVHARK